MPGQHDPRLTAVAAGRPRSPVMQYSLFGAAAARPALDDLDGLLLAGGQWVRSAGAARLSIVVADRWRADGLHDAFADRGVAETSDPVVDAATGHAVRTAFADRLVAPAGRWTRGARQEIPADLTLTSGGLRLWTIAAGHRDDAGFLLTGTSAQQYDLLHRIAGAQLAQLGVAALSLSRIPGHAGPAWRVTSARRLRRLAELVGPPPAGCGADWPDPMAAGAR